MARQIKGHGDNTVGRHTITRRQFVSSGFKSLAGAALAAEFLALEGCGRPPWLTDRSIPRVLADLHVHAGINHWNRQTPLGIQYPGIAGLAETTFNRSSMNWKDCYDTGVDLLCATHFNVFDEWVSMPTDPDPEAIVHTIRMLDLLEEELRTEAALYAQLATTPTELERLVKRVPKDSREWRVAVVHTVEGAHALGGRLDQLEPLARRGVAMVTLTHFFNKGVATAANAYPFFPDANSSWPALGLSGYGRELIQEMERLGLIVDVIHASTTALKEIFEVTTRPMVASHSSARTLGDHPYSLLDEHVQEIAHRDGLIGVIIDPYLLSNYGTAQLAEDEGTLMDVVRTIRYLAKLIGPEHVGIGSDFAGHDATEADRSPSRSADGRVRRSEDRKRHPGRQRHQVHPCQLEGSGLKWREI
jgi:microsomal dipeptidase-like Zn-dependent dipeptidase